MGLGSFAAGVVVFFGLVIWFSLRAVARKERDAIATPPEVDIADEREWRIAGARLHCLHGMVTFKPVAESEAVTPPAFAEAVRPWPR